MSEERVRAIAEAVLYEGYLLWPYRRSALKNQQRFTFGGVYPSAFAQVAGDRSEVGVECLLESNPEGVVEVTARWLHLVQRQPLARGGDDWEPVDEVASGEERLVAWEESTERECSTGYRPVAELVDGLTIPLEVPAGESVEPLGDTVAVRRSWKALAGELEVSAVEPRPGVLRLAARLGNVSDAPGTERSAALAHSFLSAHLVARCRGGAFCSSTDPPEHLQTEAQMCCNDGLWPVLAGDDGDCTVMLASPIILSDYPAVAPESPGNTFDGGEIDALLIHSIRGLTDAEREEMRATDPRTRELLERSMALSSEEMLQLYGAVREMRQVGR